MQTENILIIEDNKKYGKLVKMHLEKAGYQVSIAESGLQGLTEARHLRPSLILLDILLPELNGHQVSRLLKKDSRYRDIPIVMLTSRDLDRDRCYAAVSDVDGYLVKTDPIDKILRTIRKKIRTSHESEAAVVPA